MPDESWVMLEPDDDERLWKDFTKRFGFRTGDTPDDWPGIREPGNSVTFALVRRADLDEAHILEARLNGEILSAMREVFAPDERLIALDWHGEAHGFWPHAFESEAEAWAITPYPTHEFCVFLNEDMTAGTFGHPSERSLCVFGASLVTAAQPALIDWLPIMRRRGVSVT
ncbi:MAG: hypothetical protein JWM93_1718 [Frankiales bacterium]|nr:hypothetical protein [Frankiales bacterium]